MQSNNVLIKAKNFTGTCFNNSNLGPGDIMQLVNKKLESITDSSDRELFRSEIIRQWKLFLDNTKANLVKLEEMDLIKKGFDD